MSGAKNCPETPRQKMIGMMYLVLTAMLALNVSAEIINGFDKLRGSMEKSMAATSKRTDNLMNYFAEANADESSHARTQDWYDIAIAIQHKSDEFYNYLETFKMDIAIMVDGPMEKLPEEGLKGGSDTNKPHEYAFNQSGETGKPHAEELKEKMQEYVRYMTEVESPCVQAKMNNAQFATDLKQKADMIQALFSTENYVNQEGETVPWEEQVFHEMPAAAVMAMLTKYQNDIRTAEFDMIQFLFNQTTASAHITNATRAIVVPTNGEYIMKGGQYRAKIFTAMWDSTQVPEVYINGNLLENGEYEITANTPGLQEYSGYVMLPDDTTQYTFRGTYMVGEPQATVSNVDLDIMYREYDNKFEVSVPGVDQDKIQFIAKGATVRKNGKQYICRITDAGAKVITITVSAEIDGKMQVMNTLNYRAKNLPQSSAYLTSGGKDYTEGSSVPTARWDKNTIVSAGYGEDGLLELGWTVTSFKLEVGGKEFAIQGNHLSQDMLTAIAKAKINTTIMIKNIRAKADGSNKDTGLPSLTLTKGY